MILGPCASKPNIAPHAVLDSINATSCVCAELFFFKSRIEKLFITR